MTDIALRPHAGIIGNDLLRAIPPEELDRLVPYLKRLDLPAKTVLLTENAPIENAYFPESATASMVATLEDGTLAEVGLIGHEGMVGLPLLLGVPTSPLEAVVQVEGVALRLHAAAFSAAMAETPTLYGLLLRYVDAFQVQISQTAICNARHHIEQRLARWLLMTHDRVDGDSFTMTQEFMSNMLGVRRPGVTLALGALKRAGLVDHKRV